MSAYSEFRAEVVSLTLKATAETQEEALNQILALMRRQVMAERKGPILFMAPANVTVTQRTVQSRTERFLGVLWPRTRYQHTIEAQIDVEVRWLRFLVPDGQQD